MPFDAFTMPRSVALPSSGRPVGLVSTAIEREWGDQRGFDTWKEPDVRRFLWPVATSTTHRWLNCSCSSSTTWSHFFFRQPRTCRLSVSSCVYAIVRPSGDQAISPTDSG